MKDREGEQVFTRRRQSSPRLTANDFMKPGLFEVVDNQLM